MTFDTTIDAQANLTISAECLMAEVDGEYVLMNVANGLYYGLDAIGTDILKRLSAAPLSLAALLDGLYLDYQADRTVIETDTRNLLGQLLEHKLITAIAQPCA